MDIGSNLAALAIAAGVKELWKFLNTQGCKVHVTNDTPYLVRLARIEALDGLTQYSAYPESLSRLSALDGRLILEHQSIVEQFQPSSLCKSKTYDLFLQYEIRQFEADPFPRYLQIFVHVKRRSLPYAVVRLTSEFMRLDQLSDFLEQLFQKKSLKQNLPMTAMTAGNKSLTKSDIANEQSSGTNGSTSKPVPAYNANRLRRVRDSLRRSLRLKKANNPQSAADSPTVPDPPAESRCISAFAAKLDIGGAVILRAELSHSTSTDKPLDIKVVISRDLNSSYNASNGHQRPSETVPIAALVQRMAETQTLHYSAPMDLKVPEICEEPIEHVISRFQLDLADYYRAHFSTVEMFEGCPKFDISEVFVNLSWQQRTSSGTVVAHFNIIDTLNRMQEEKCNLLVVNGHPGKGKTTFVKKLCCDWLRSVKTTLSSAVKNSSSFLSSIKLLITVCLRDVTEPPSCWFPPVNCGNDAAKSTDPSILTMIFNHYIQKPYTEEAVSAICRWISDNPDQVLLVLDGYDEFRFRLDPAGLLYSQLHVDRPVQLPVRTILTSRPYCTTDLRCRQLEVFIQGLEETQALQFVENYCSQLAPAQLSRIIDHFKKIEHKPSHAVIIDTPMLLHMWCTLAVEKQVATADESGTVSLPTNRAQLYHEICRFIVARFYKRDSSKSPIIVKEWEDLPIIANLKKLAFDFTATPCQQFSFSEETLKQYKLEHKGMAFEFGFLLFDIKPSLYGIKSSASFFHKSIQDYFAALFVVDEILRLAQNSKSSKLKTLFRATDSAALGTLVKHLRVDCTLFIDLLWFVYETLEQRHVGVNADFLTSDKSGLSEFINAYQVGIFVASSENYRNLDSDLLLERQSLYNAVFEMLQWELDLGAFLSIVYGNNVSYATKLPGISIQAIVCAKSAGITDLLFLDACKQQQRWHQLKAIAETGQQRSDTLFVNCLAIRSSVGDAVSLLQNITERIIVANNAVISVSANANFRGAPYPAQPVLQQLRPINAPAAEVKRVKVHLANASLAIIPNCSIMTKRPVLDLTELLECIDISSIKHLEIGRRSNVVYYAADIEVIMTQLEQNIGLETFALRGLRLKQSADLLSLLKIPGLQKSLVSLTLHSIDLSQLTNLDEVFANFTSLRSLCLNSCSLSGDLLQRVSKQLNKKLEKLDFSGSDLSDSKAISSICKTFSKTLLQLQRIELRNCNIQDLSVDAVKSIIDSCQKLCSLDLRWNGSVSPVGNERLRLAATTRGPSLELRLPRDA